MSAGEVVWLESNGIGFHTQPILCSKCRSLINGRVAVVRLKKNQEYAQIFCERCGETLEQRNGRR